MMIKQKPIKRDRLIALTLSMYIPLAMILFFSFFVGFTDVTFSNTYNPTTFLEILVGIFILLIFLSPLVLPIIVYFIFKNRPYWRVAAIILDSYVILLSISIFLIYMCGGASSEPYDYADSGPFNILVILSIVLFCMHLMYILRAKSKLIPSEYVIVKLP